MKRFFFVLIVLIFPSLCHAQTQVLGHVKLPDTTAPANAKICISLINFKPNVPRVSGTGQLITTTNFCQTPAADGSYSFSIYGNNVITPSTTNWRVDWLFNGIQTSSATYLINHSPFNLDTEIPLSSSTPAGPNQLILNVFPFTQLTPATTWTIPHNFNDSNTIALLAGLNGNDIYPDTKNCRTDPNNCTVTFVTPTAGFAIALHAAQISIASSQPNAIVSNPIGAQVVNAQPLTIQGPTTFQDTVSTTNVGVFTNTNMNNYLYSLLGGCSLATEIEGNANATQAVAGCVPIPVGATINNAAGVAGFANTSCNSLARTVCNAVGGYFQARTLQSNAAVWGINALVNDVIAGTNTGHHMLGAEIDVNVFGSPAFVRGVSILMGGSGTIPANNGAGLEIFAGSGGGTAKWSPAIVIDRAATSNLGIVLDGLLDTNPTNSQQISFSGYDGGGIGRQSSIRGTSNGDLQLQPNTGAAYYVVNNAGGFQIPGSTSGQAIIMAPAVAGTPTLTLPTATGTFLSTGSGAGNLIQTARATSCTTAAPANSVCSTDVPWANSFADTNFTLSCSLVAANQAQAAVTHATAFTNKATVEISNFSVATAASGTIHCTAIHD